MDLPRTDMYMHTHTYMCKHQHTHTPCTHIYTQTYMCMYVHTYAHTQTYVCMHPHTHTSDTHVCIHASTHIKHMRVLIYTDTSSRVSLMWCQPYSTCFAVSLWKGDDGILVGAGGIFCNTATPVSGHRQDIVKDVLHQDRAVCT